VSSPVSETSYDVQVYQAAATNNGCTVTSVGNPASLSVVAEQTLTNGVTSFSITTPLTSNTTNCFLVTATEESGNESSVPFGGTATVVPTIHQGDTKTQPNAAAAAGGDNVGVGEVDATVLYNGDSNSSAGAQLQVQAHSTCCSGSWAFGTMTVTTPPTGGGNGNFTLGYNSGLSLNTTYNLRVVIIDSNGFDGANVGLCDEYYSGTIKADGTGSSTQCTVSRTSTGGSQNSWTVTTPNVGNHGNNINAPTASGELASRSQQTATVTVSKAASTSDVVTVTVNTAVPKTLPGNSGNCSNNTGTTSDTFTWDGKDGSGNFVADGIYTMTAYRYASSESCPNPNSANVHEVQNGTIVVSNVASILPLDPPPGSASLQPGQTVAIVATAMNYNNNTLASGSNTNGTCASGQSKCQIMFSASPASAGSFSAPSFGTGSRSVGGVDVGQTQTNQCP